MKLFVFAVLCLAVVVTSFFYVISFERRQLAWNFFFVMTFMFIAKMFWEVWG